MVMHVTQVVTPIGLLCFDNSSQTLHGVLLQDCYAILTPHVVECTYDWPTSCHAQPAKWRHPACGDRSKYGSTLKYLEHIGFGPEDQTRLQRSLLDG